LYFGQCDDFIYSFWDFMTFSITATYIDILLVFFKGHSTPSCDQNYMTSQTGCITWNSFLKYMSLLYNRVGARALRTFYLSCCLCAMILIFNSLKRGGWLHSAKSCHDFYVLFWLIFHANFLWWCKDFEKKVKPSQENLIAIAWWYLGCTHYTIDTF
jgi:hypothetical protein